MLSDSVESDLWKIDVNIISVKSKVKIEEGRSVKQVVCKNLLELVYLKHFEIALFS